MGSHYFAKYTRLKKKKKVAEKMLAHERKGLWRTNQVNSNMLRQYLKCGIKF